MFPVSSIADIHTDLWCNGTLHFPGPYKAKCSLGTNDVNRDQQTGGQQSRKWTFWNVKTDGLAAFGFWYLNKDINFLDFETSLE